MQFKLKTVIFFSIALLGTVLAAPITEVRLQILTDQDTLTHCKLAAQTFTLVARSVTVTVSYDPSGDYKNLLTRPPNPAALPAGCAKADKKAFNKQKQKCETWDSKLADFQADVKPRIIAVIDAAAASLHLPSTLTVYAKSSWHDHADHDDLNHVTFSFQATVCGTGCVGHAYKAGAPNGRVGKIFSGAHKTIFGVGLLHELLEHISSLLI
jgi:hypothetical protein